MRRPIPFLCAVLAAAAGLSGCEALQRTDSLFGFITPYRIDIVQGNAITKEQAALVKPGLSRLQVRDILGTPMLIDPFHADRWDYIFTLRRPGTEPQRRSVVVTFEKDVVKAINARRTDGNQLRQAKSRRNTRCPTLRRSGDVLFESERREDPTTSTQLPSGRREARTRTADRRTRRREVRCFRSAR